MKTMNRREWERTHGILAVILTHAYGDRGGDFIAHVAADWRIGHENGEPVEAGNLLPNGFLMVSSRPVISGYWMSDDVAGPSNIHFHD